MVVFYKKHCLNHSNVHFGKYSKGLTGFWDSGLRRVLLERSFWREDLGAVGGDGIPILIYKATDILSDGGRLRCGLGARLWEDKWFTIASMLGA